MGARLQPAVCSCGRMSAFAALARIEGAVMPKKRKGYKKRVASNLYSGACFMFSYCAVFWCLLHVFKLRRARPCGRANPAGALWRRRCRGWCGCRTGTASRKCCHLASTACCRPSRSRRWARPELSWRRHPSARRTARLAWGWRARMRTLSPCVLSGGLCILGCRRYCSGSWAEPALTVCAAGALGCIGPSCAVS